MSAEESAREMISRLAPVLTERAGVRFAILFGSQASGTAGPSSDVDIAAAFERPPELLELGSLVTQLEDRAERRVDLVDLSGLPTRDPFLSYQIVAGGRLISGDADEFVAFRARAFSCYFDALPFLERVRADLTRRLKDGNFARPIHA